jgi:hypothetical protein
LAVPKSVELSTPGAKPGSNFYLERMVR